MHCFVRTFILLFAAVPVIAQWIERESGTFETLWDVGAPEINYAVVVGDNGTVMQSEDFGATWTPQTVEPEVSYRAISFANSAVAVAAGTSGTILFTNDGGGEWTTIETGWMHPYHAAHQYSPLGGVVAGVNSIFQPIVGYTTNGWDDYDFLVFYPHHDGSDYEGTIADIHYFNADTGIAAIRIYDGQGAICRTVDGGDNWETVHWNISSMYAVDFGDELFGCAVGAGGTIVTTADGGQTWGQVTSPTGSELMDVSFGSPQQVWAVGFGGTIIRSEDAGADWTTQGSPVGADLHGISMVNSEIGYAAGANGTILYTANGGVPPTNNPPGEFFRTMPADSDTLATPEVLFTWTASEDPDSEQVTYIARVWSNYFDWADSITTTDIEWWVVVPWPLSPLDDYFSFWWTVHATDGIDTVAAANGQGAFTMDIIMGAEDHFIPDPSSLSLSAYPNPFNPTTTLELSLPAPSEATLRVFDVTGRLVRETSLGRLASGSHRVSLNATGLPSGIYLAAIETPTQRTTQKLVLMK